MTEIIEEYDDPVSLSEGIRGIWRHAHPYRKQLSLLIALGLVSAAANGAVPYVTGRFFDALISLSQGKTMTDSALPFWAMMLIAWAVIQFVANISDWVIDRTRRKIDCYMHLSIQAEGMVHLLKLPLSFHTNEHMNAVLQKISIAGWRISAIVRNLTQIAPQLLSVVIGIVLAASINVFMAGILATGVLIYVLSLAFMLRPIAAIDHEAHKMWNEHWDNAAAVVQQATAVKQAVAESYEIGKTRENLAGKVADKWYSLEKIWSNVGSFQRLIVFLTQLSVFVASVTFVAKGSMTIGDLVALNGYALLFFGPFVQLGYSWQVIQNGITSAGQLERLFLKKEEDYHPADAVAATERSGKIVFDKVSFDYGNGGSEVLSNLSFTANPGQTIALVGESGSGKSTAISLISGYYFPSAGNVRVDGIDTQQWDLTALRERIAVVPQEVALFNDTIRANIRYGAFDASDEAVEQAARQAHIHDFIEKQSKGYGTIVGERGIKLSVGQKQRIAIARAILRNPEILILDEPTSALDSETEAAITASLENLMRGRTTFIIAHRLSTVRAADTILVIKNGTVVEQGSHEALMTIDGGVYRHLYELHIGLHE